MIRALWQEMRPRQWTKNVLVYAAPAFKGVLFDAGAALLATEAFFAFCLVASGIYFWNDIFDVEADRAHPTKRFRPVAAGRIPMPAAYVAAAALLAGGLVLAYAVNAACCGLIASYVVVNIAYTLRLKHVVILDVMIVAYGFVVRAVLGAAATGVGTTAWFLLCVLFLSLFLALGKRRHELQEIERGARPRGRKVLQYYSLGLIDQFMTIATTALLMCYALFAIDAPDHARMALTIPLVLYGMFYYLYLVRVRQEGGAPDEMLYRAKPILCVVALYVLCIVAFRNV